MINIFIANLDWEISSADLNATFSSFGEVHLAHVVFDPKTKKSKGFGYVEMPDAEEAIKAIMALNGFEVNGRKLDVKIASPKGSRPEPKPAQKPKKPGFRPGGGFNKGPKRDFTSNREFSQNRDFSQPRTTEGEKPATSGTGERVLRPRRNRNI